MLVPHSERAAGKLRWELDNPGVYFLFGDDEDGAKPIVYIGQTEDARKRFDSYTKTKTFWKTAIFYLSKSQSFPQAHIRYLEWYCLQQAKEVGRYELGSPTRLMAADSIATVPIAGRVPVAILE